MRQSSVGGALGQPDGDDDVGATIPPWQAARQRSARTPSFAVSAVLAGRYRIERFVAFGGMGEVYAAEDLELREKVALKTIRQEVAEDPRIVDRFKREIALARKVTHRNVCRIFDFGVHTVDGRPAQTFLTMELLEGRSLADHLASDGAMKPEAAAPILEQMAAALEAAHHAGIIHRDFKSGNVILTQDALGTRAVVTDFGLARASDADPFSTNAEADGGMVGSPVYMAPEQVEGAAVDKRADIYALGVVLFEMVTANIPFTGESAMAIAVKRIKEPAPSPRMFAPTLPTRWEQAILRCLERAPEARFGTAGEVARFVLGSEAKGSADPATTATVPALPSPKAKKPRSLVLVGGGVVAAAALGLGAVAVLRPRPEPTKTAVVAPNQPARRSVAVVGFSNVAQKPDQDWISTALSEMFTTELGFGGKLRLVAGESVGRMKQELQLQSAASYAPDTLDKIRRNLDADVVIVGSYIPLGGQLRLDVRMQDAATGETLAQVAETATEADLASVVTRVSAQLRDKLQVAQTQKGEGVAFVNTALPQNPEAAKLYAEGLSKTRLYKMSEARDLLERAIRIEPSFPLAHAVMYEALSYLGYEDQARDEVKRAFELRDKLPTEERLRIEGLYYYELGDKKRRYEAVRELYQMAPDNIEYGMSYINALFAVDEKAGLAAFEKIAATPQAQKEPRFYLVKMSLLYARHEFEALIAESKKLEKAGEERGTLSFIGEAKGQQAFSHWFLGDLRDGVAAADEARRITFSLGDRDGVAMVLTTKAFLLSDLGDYDGAQKASEDALNFAAEVGSRRRVWLAQHTLARAYTFRGDLREGLRQFEASRATAVEQGAKYGEAIAYIGIAATKILQGELKEAQPTFDKILFQSRLFAPKNAIAYVQHFRGELFRSTGDWKEARAAYEESKRIRDEFHDKFQAERDRLGLAHVALREGKLDEAQQNASDASQVFSRIGDHDDEAFAQCVLVRVALAKGQKFDAERAWKRAAEIAATTQAAAVKLDAAHAHAELLAATGKPSEAKTLLDETITAAQQKGLLGYALAMRLTRLKILRDESAPQVSAEAQKLRTEAEQRGFKWIAAMASAP